MSWQASAHVLKLAEHTSMRELSPSHIVVLYALAARHNDRDYHCAFGQLERMARDTHLHVVTLSRLLGQLEDRGIITVWEGQLPALKDSPDDGRRTRGTMWCFVGLDLDDGPNIVGAVPRVRTSGRPRAKSISATLNHFGRSISRNEVDELAGNGRSISAAHQTELAGLISSLKPDSQPDVKPDSQPDDDEARARASNGGGEVVSGELFFETDDQDRIDAVEMILAPLGLQGEPAFWRKVLDTYSELDLEAEAFKQADWLRRHRIADCSTTRYLNWLSRATAGQAANADHPQRNGHASNGLALRASLAAAAKYTNGRTFDDSEDDPEASP